MATVASMARRDQLARERVSAATSALAERHGITPTVVPFIRDPKLAQIAQLEAHADLLEALVDAKGGDPTSPAAEVVEDAADQGVALGVEVDPQGEPVVVTESVDGEVAATPQPNPTLTNGKPPAKKGKA